MFHCTSLRLPPEAPIKRESTRPVEFRQPGFDKAFDVSTLFYDLIGRELPVEDGTVGSLNRKIIE